MSVQTIATTPHRETRPEGAGRPVTGSWSPARMAGWGVLALALGAFAVFESWKYGLPTTAAALLFLVAPDLVARAARGRGKAAAYAFNGWLPLAVLVFYTFGPVVWPPLFTAALAWLLRIVAGRMTRRG
ncbi:hypothetical protein ACWF94_15545 [Streptomyces sp. NPDC055078]